MITLATVFVEGTTDVRLYKAIFRGIFNCHFVKADEEEHLKDILRRERVPRKLFPWESALFLNCPGKLVILHGCGGYSRLLSLLEGIEDKAIGILRRKFETVNIQTNYGELGRFELWFIFDEDARDKVGSVYRFRFLDDYIFVEFQKTPEEFVLKNFEKIYRQESVERILYHDCLSVFEKRLRVVSLKKRAGLIKTIIGERCYDHLFEVIISKIKERIDEGEEKFRYIPEWLSKFCTGCY